MKYISRIVLLAVASILAIGLPGRAQTRVQSGGNWCSSCTTVDYPLAGTVNVTSGDLLVVMSLSCNSGTAGCTSNAAPSLSDTLNNVWTAAVSSFGAAGQGQINLWYTCSSIGGKDTIAVAGSNPADMHVHFYEYSGVVTSGCLDQTGTATSSSSSPNVTTSGSVTQSSELVIGFIGDWETNQNISAWGGYTVEAQTNDNTYGESAGSEDNNTRTGLSGPQTLGFSSLDTASKQLLVATFKASSSGGGTTVAVTQTLDISGLTYNINQANLLSFTGCLTTDTSCTMEVQLCDPSGNCLHFAPGSHSLVVNFVSMPKIPTTQVVTSQVATSSFTVTIQ
jgi:hypothetical protein